jgi:membrane fusion protein, macrolide-specific efflux system
MQSRIRRRLGIAVLAVVILSSVSLWAKENFLDRKVAAPITAVATRMDIEESVLASGSMEAFKTVDVGAQVSGQLKTLHVHLGDQVRKGELLAEIDPVLQENALKDSEASQENVRAQIVAKKALLHQYQLALSRQQQLAAQDAVSQADLESAQASVATTRADLAALQAQLNKARVAVDTARANLQYTRIVAPMDGVVIGILTQEGQTVNSAQTAPTILRLANLDTITVKAQISEADITKVKPGQKVYFTILGDPDTRHYAVLRATEPATDSASSSSSTSTSSSSSSSSTTAIYYNGLFDVPNPGHRLRVSMTAQVSILLNEARQVLAIPVGALPEKGRGGRTTVKVLVHGESKDRTIRTGISNNVNIQVLEGLQQGERVVVGETSVPAATTTGPMHPGPPPGGH